MSAVPIVALDVPDQPGAIALVDRLGDACNFFKIGGELFTATGPVIVETLRSRGKRVFLDLKFHDIPNTVRSAARSAAGAGATLITVHGIGGRAMIAAAVEGAGQNCGVLAVTVLTSLDESSLSQALGKAVSVSDEVSRIATIAREAGAHGVVCSGQEAARIAAENGKNLAILVPGVRLAGDSAHDQSRVVRPADAVKAGATYLVLGRTVTAASDPAAALARVLDEIALAAA
ncbi:MAG TPA: orotidine-5'-phosphate decarboxylase [Gemmatimonadaceae bacterium]|nr:orotidine-5'-phosphate decarboxylase [Gemmatimonadaceae bacterium]